MFEIEKGFDHIYAPFSFGLDKKTMDLGLYLVYPTTILQNGSRIKVIKVVQVLAIMYMTSKGKTERIDFVSIDKKYTYTKVGKINKYTYGKILTTKPYIEEAVKVIQKHLRDLHYEEYQKYNEELYSEVIYQKG